MGTWEVSFLAGVEHFGYLPIMSAISSQFETTLVGVKEINKSRNTEVPGKDDINITIITF